MGDGAPLTQAVGRLGSPGSRSCSTRLAGPGIYGSGCPARSWGRRRFFCVLHPERRPGSYEELRRNPGRCILLGLEVLIVADIVRTIIVDPTYESVVVLGVVVVVRILLSFALEVEMDGMWPWNRWQRQTPKP